MYSTSDPEQLKAFLERTDILVASLPSTLSTKGLLTRERLGAFIRSCHAARIPTLSEELSADR